MAKLMYLYIPIYIMWHITGGNSQILRIADFMQNTSLGVTQFNRNFSIRDEIIQPIYNDYITNLSKKLIPLSAMTDDDLNGFRDIQSNPRHRRKNRDAEPLDVEDNHKRFEWLRTANQFNRNSTGIIFTGRLDPKVLTQDFCRIMTVTGGGNSTGILLSTISGNRFNTTCGSNWQVFLYLSNVDRVANSWPNLVHTNSVVLITVILNRSLMNQLINKIKTNGVQYGYSFDADECKNYFEAKSKRNPYLYDLLKDPEGIMYNFRFKETLESIQAGALRMFSERVELFEECKNMVFSNRNSNHSTELGFTLTEYYKMNDFDDSARDMQVYVKYITLLSNWTETQKDTVVFIGTDVDNLNTVGWYSKDNNSNDQIITKREQALKLSISQYTQPATANALSTQSVLLMAGVPLVFIILMFASAFYFVQNYYKRNALSNDIIQHFLHGDVNNSDDQVNNLPYDKEKYEIPEGSFTIDEDKPLGSGEFGRVCRGTITKFDDQITVAVKTPNLLKFHKTIVQGLLSEIKVLAYLGKHQNISELLGANIAKLREGKVFIFLEFCELGSLEKYLRDDLGGQFSRENILDVTVYQDMYRWSVEICNGMSYLAEKHVVHADLATRNVLLNQQKEAKICDFGLSRRMLNYENYVKSGQEPLPWKWMAPESLTSNTFSEKSDVWAFGVTFWEIYSLGELPYPGLSWEINFPQCLEYGLRLPEPKYNEKDMYDLMKNCWRIKPEERPSFSCIRRLLGTRVDAGITEYETVL